MDFGNFDTFVDKMRVISGGRDHCECEMTIEQRHVNALGTLHGGCTATLVDVVSSLALLSTPPHRLSVSVELNVSYLRGVKLGDDILIEARNLKSGKNLAFLEVAIKRKSDGQLVATGKHTKFIPETESSKSLL